MRGYWARDDPAVLLIVLTFLAGIYIISLCPHDVHHSLLVCSIFHCILLLAAIECILLFYCSYMGSWV